MYALPGVAPGRLLLLLGLLSALCQPPLVWGQEAEPYLHGPQGPYRGRVVELLTERPLPGALIIVVWESDRDDDGGRSVFALRETLTDAAGEFMVDASAIEAVPPPRAYPPRLLIYKPGYVTYPRERGRRFGVPASRFTGSGRVVQLKPVRDEEERAEAFNTFVASLGGFTGDPVGGLLSESARVFREELERFIREATQNPGAWEKEQR